MTLYRNKNALFVNRRDKFGNSTGSYMYNGMKFFRMVKKNPTHGFLTPSYEYHFKDDKLNNAYVLETHQPKFLRKLKQSNKAFWSVVLTLEEKQNLKIPTVFYGLFINHVVVCRANIDLKYDFQVALENYKHHDVETRVMKKLLVENEILLCFSEDLEKSTTAFY